MSTKANEKICPGCLDEFTSGGKTIVMPCLVPNDAGKSQRINVKTTFCFYCAEMYKALPASNRRKVRERFNRNLLRDLEHK